jgi:hypothetical protein
MDILSIFGSIVAGAASGWLVGIRNIYAKNVTEERAKWREKMRSITDRINCVIIYGIDGSENKIKKLKRLRTQLMVRLNPNDNYDNPILLNIDRLLNDPTDTKALDDLNDKMARLFKFEWDKAKWECLFIKLPCFLKKRIEPDRSGYEKQ